ncbi:hydroxyphenylacetyl-CoA thioesterase PaaI [Aureimonas populi]|uniref:Hydroxyphenylacetyl-CoA thioesterase PaaI n=1 Tax=Aureimonas populi TaxID=1701758 RepID=A0ABW5CIR8_9HYPH|nr:hydroxyphenylacetyl-CoA thioesterase PaaI [Aureimonas populi]
MSPQELALACAAAMWAEDRASQGLGVEIASIAPGAAELAMNVREDMVNGHGTAHGGFIFALADSAFAFAANTRDERCVAGQCHIAYLRPARLGDRLMARASEVRRVGRSGIYDVSVSANGEVIAEFRGHSRTVGQKLLT